MKSLFLQTPQATVVVTLHVVVVASPVSRACEGLFLDVKHPFI
jgi:hypothetical protein